MTMSFIVLLWKTKRIRVSRTTIKGKNERMTFAATEKAKVWTSVVSKYCAVGHRRAWNERASRIARVLRPGADFAGLIAGDDIRPPMVAANEISAGGSSARKD